MSGYSQNFEYEADRTAQRMIAQLGYAPSAVATVIGKLPDKEGEGANSYAITHPEKESRIGALESSVSNLVLFPFSGGRGGGSLPCFCRKLSRMRICRFLRWELSGLIAMLGTVGFLKGC